MHVVVSFIVITLKCKSSYHKNVLKVIIINNTVMIHYFRWFHGNITGREAEALLLDKGQESSFLIRASTHSPGNYVLSTRISGEIAHVIIHHSNKKFSVGGGPSFTTLSEVVDYYRCNPMIETSGRVINLKIPFHATSFAPSCIEKRVSELEKESKDITGKAGFWEEFEVGNGICILFCFR